MLTAYTMPLPKTCHPKQIQIRHSSTPVSRRSEKQSCHKSSASKAAKPQGKTSAGLPTVAWPSLAERDMHPFTWLFHLGNPISSPCSSAELRFQRARHSAGSRKGLLIGSPWLSARSGLFGNSGSAAGSSASWSWALLRAEAAEGGFAIVHDATYSCGIFRNEYL